MHLWFFRSIYHVIISSVRKDQNLHIKWIYGCKISKTRNVDKVSIRFTRFPPEHIKPRNLRFNMGAHLKLGAISYIGVLNYFSTFRKVGTNHVNILVLGFLPQFWGFWEIVMAEAFGKFRNTPPRVIGDVRARRRKPQPATETLSHNIAKRWRMGETRRSHGKWYFEFLNTRRETGVEQSKDRRVRIMGSFMYLW